MLGWDTEDSLTTINTALNKAMVLLDSPDDRENKIKVSKSIKINTKAQPPYPSGATTPVTARRSILKKSRAHEISEDRDSDPTLVTSSINDHRIIARNDRSIVDHAPRPRNLEDFAKENTVIVPPARATFNLEELSDNEEMWLMDIPKTVNPKSLKGQSLLLGEKSKLKIEEERYCAVNRDNGGCLTWVFATGRDGKPYKAVNIKPSGTIAVRRKLSAISKGAVESSNRYAVPFPSNLKIRHPFFGPNDERERTTRQSCKRKRNAKSMKRCSL